MYDVKSMKAEEFINHQEIEDTLAYADLHKDDMPLILSLIHIFRRASERSSTAMPEAALNRVSMSANIRG